ncbi:hypothetical protein FRB91_001989 [Serendipita sp. 411]|nr:hypothetical protein FRB91_001989 [Serendipita sp. 411]
MAFEWVVWSSSLAMSKQRISRAFHAANKSKKILVGPPHPISNIRPTLYDGLPDQTPTKGYSPRDLSSHEAVDPDRFQLNLSMQRLDKFNHEFWADSNTRFHTMKEAYLNSRKGMLELATTPEERSRMEEDHLAEFYRLWVFSERPTQRRYNSQWLKYQYTLIWTTARMTLNRWIRKLSLS